jgi:hypothetical protein
MRLSLLVAAFVAGVGIQASADDLDDFIKSKPPRFVFVSNVNVEKNLFKVVIPMEKVVQRTIDVDVVKDGKTVKEKATVAKAVVEHFEQDMVLSNLVVTTAGGKEVPAADLVALKNKTVLLAVDEAGVHALYRKMLAKDSYVVAVRPAKK